MKSLCVCNLSFLSVYHLWSTSAATVHFLPFSFSSAAISVLLASSISGVVTLSWHGAVGRASASPVVVTGSAAASGSGSSALSSVSSSSSTRSATIPIVLLASIAHFNFDSATTDSGSIQTSHSVLGISRILHLHKCKTRRSSGNPNIPHGSVLRKSILQIIPIGIISETSNIDFTGNIPISVSHFDKIFWTLKLLNFVTTINNVSPSILYWKLTICIFWINCVCVWLL